MEATCSVDGCDRPVNARGFCKRHYYRWSRYGDPLGTPPPRDPKPRRPLIPCTVEDCERDQYAHGLCEAHYARQRRHGGLHDQRSARRDPVERFWEKVDKDGPIPDARPDLGPCWLWTGAPNGAGYGSFGMGGAANTVGAHVAACLLAGIDVPKGYEPDHLCRVKLCVRLDHIEVVSAAENKRRAWDAMRASA